MVGYVTQGYVDVGCNAFNDIIPTMAVHNVNRIRHIMNVLHRVPFTRLKVSGHPVVMETVKQTLRGRGREQLPGDG